LTFVPSSEKYSLFFSGASILQVSCINRNANSANSYSFKLDRAL
jgi:hypothetical protein